MRWVFTYPYPELQAALEASGQTVDVQDRYVVGDRRHIDEIKYPFRQILTAANAPQVMVFPDLWDGRLGYNRNAFNKWRGTTPCVFVTCQYRTPDPLPSNCRAAITDGHIGLYQNEAQALAHAATKRAVLWQHDEVITPLLAAVRDVQQGKTYRAYNEHRYPYRNP